MKPSITSFLLVGSAFQLVAFTSLRADNTSADKASTKAHVTTCIVSGEPLQPGDIHTFVYKEEGRPGRTIRLGCRKCVARFKSDPERFLKKLDQLEAEGKTANKDKTDR